MSDYIDKGEADSFENGQKELFDLDSEPEEFDEIDKAYRREQLQWLADRPLHTARRQPQIFRLCDRWWAFNRVAPSSLPMLK
jgi:hypothetical protein